MKNYNKPAIELSKYTVKENISTTLSDWLMDNNIDKDVGITTYYLSSEDL